MTTIFSYVRNWLFYHLDFAVLPADHSANALPGYYRLSISADGVLQCLDSNGDSVISTAALPTVIDCGTF